MDKAARKKDRADQKKSSPGQPPGTVEEYPDAMPDDLGPGANEPRPGST